MTGSVGLERAASALCIVLWACEPTGSAPHAGPGAAPGPVPAQPAGPGDAGGAPPVGTFDGATPGTSEPRSDGGPAQDAAALGDAAIISDGGRPLPRPKRDPGLEPWPEGSPEQCGLDLSALDDGAIDHYAIYRYGLRCHVKGDVGATKMYSATKTLGGVAVGRVAQLTQGLVSSGPGTGPLRSTDRAIDWLGSVSYNRDATLGHVLAMCAQSADLTRPVFQYDGIGVVQINSLIAASERAYQQLPALRSTPFAKFVEREVFAPLGMTGSRFLDLGLATGWEATLADMAKLGALIMHGGVYGGEQLLDADWVYRMTHPAFELANPAYGLLMWLNTRGHPQGGGGDLTGTSPKHLDPCAPAALWSSYPHPPSTATDCRPDLGRDCRQTYDVGVASAEGLNGQFIVLHPGLDLVVVAQDFVSSDGVRALWDAVRPAIVARDPVYAGNEAAFCAAYAANAYAPDL